MPRYIIELPAGKPDWVEIGVKVRVRDRDNVEWSDPCVLIGYKSESDFPFLVVANGTVKYTSWRYAKPCERWEPKEGEWVAGWNDINLSVGRFRSMHNREYRIDDVPYLYCARITNDDGSLIDIRCTVDELKARTDWLGLQEK